MTEGEKRLPPASTKRATETAAYVTRSRMYVAGAFVVGLLLTGVGVAMNVASRRATEAAEFAQSARRVATHMEQSLLTPLSSLHALHALRLANPQLDRAAFARFAQPLMQRHPSLAALEWLQVVQDQDRATFEQTLSATLLRPAPLIEPDAHGKMQVASKRDRYSVLVRMEPENEALLGFNVEFEPDRTSAVEQAIRQAAPSVSSKIRLIEDPPEVYSIAVYDPIYLHGVVPASPTERLHNIEGFAIALYRIAPLVHAALNLSDLGGADLALIDEAENVPPEQRVLFETRAGVDQANEDRLSYRQGIRFAGRSWAVVLARESHLTSGPLYWRAAFGVLASVLLAGLVFAVQRAARWRRKYDDLKSMGQYTLLRELGSGGMGCVYEARHALLRRPAAIKVIASEEASNEEIERFDREAQLTSQLTHPNTVVLFDYGRTQRGDFYYAMEYVKGITLDELVRKQGPQPAERVRHLILQICGALAEAHELGFVHRDIKPANIMLTMRGGIYDFIKVLDFGLAKATRSTDMGISRVGAVIGTPRYMAPECFVSSEAIGPQSDMYAVGCVAYFLLTGHDAFVQQDNASLALAHLTLAPPPMHDQSGQPIAPALEKIVLRCLAKKPEDRYSGTRQLIAALTRCDLNAWSQAEAAERWVKLEMELSA